MAIWDNQSEEMKNKILQGLSAFDRILRRDKRKDKRKGKIENVLRTRS